MKVFVSSTFLDLRRHRKAVDQILGRLTAQFTGMEYFGSRPTSPRRVSLDEISHCDVFVGIYAHRYGSIQNGSTTSITEQEFDFAQSRGMDCYCYVVDPNYRWRPGFIEHDKANELNRLLQKINHLVRSTFTTPDNLAMQVAADLRSAIENRSRSIEVAELQESLNKSSAREISTTIGPKYIKELYVDRALGQQLKLRMDSLRGTQQSIKSINADCEELQVLLRDLTVPSLPREAQEAYEEVTNSLTGANETLTVLQKVDSYSEELCYPADQLYSSFSPLKKGLSEARRGDLPRFLPDEELKLSWDATSTRLLDTVANLERSLRPISLIVDRAGGGKTNLLCRLVEQLGDTYPVVFFAAKSIPYPSEEAIAQYLSATYPLGPEPIRVALSTVAKEQIPILLVIDGINENLDPAAFNAGFKAFVRRYYGAPVLYLVSCRDIYWKYFEDEWWSAHCGFISRDELYAFTRTEFRKALSVYLRAYDIDARPVGNAREQLHHPLLLRFYCEAFKGVSGKPTKVGKVEDIRLLDLFDVYCLKKFKQIKERLGLISGDEVFSYLKVIARMMLRMNTRLLSATLVNQTLRKEFFESGSSLRSMYVQILDEDILLEQKPTGIQMEMVVSFVYDEFMEYVIAKALWADISSGRVNPSYEKIEGLAEGLLEQEASFISVLGVLVYLGEILSIVSKDHLQRYIDWLIAKGREILVCKLIVRLPHQALDDSLFTRLVEFHRTSHGSLKREAWKSMERVGIRHWRVFFEYVCNLELRKTQSPMSVFGMLGRLRGGPTPEDQVATLEWLVGLFEQNAYLLRGKNSRDHTSAVTAINSIVSSGKRSWQEQELARAYFLINRANIF
jgi:hypothetical protein